MIFYHTFSKKNYEVIRIRAFSDVSYFKKSGAQRVSDESAAELRRVIEEIAEVIAKNAIDNLNNVGLPVFLNPIYEIVPITRPTNSPTKFRIISKKNSNYADSVTVLNKVSEQIF